MTQRSEGRRGCDRRTVVGCGAAAATMAAVGSALAQEIAQERPTTPPTVATTAGIVRGSVEARNVYVFKGIPYAADAGGANRFMPPRPVEPWSGTRDAIAYGARPPALGYPPILMPEEGVDLDNGPMHEDSLFLNVWTGGLGGGERRPVMVWLHGGGFTSGSGGSVRYDGTNLAARRGVVLVTVNHRLGVLGFFSLARGGEKYARSGNLGMLDIVQALQWVRDNIANFGGDPDNVTVFGESGGGGKATTLMAMPAAKGLFHRVIAQSGVNIRAIAADAAEKTAQGVLAKLGIEAGSIDKLAALPWSELIAAGGNGPWGPVVDGADLPRAPFEPDAALSAGVPMLLGTTLTEATFFKATPLDPIDDATLLAKIVDNTKLDPTRSGRLIEAFRAAWPGRDNTFIYARIASWGFQVNNVSTVAERRAAQGAAQAGAAATYLYSFEMLQGARGGKLMVPHTSEIAYAFDNLELSTALVGPVTLPHQELADAVSEAWTTFARTGRPAAARLPPWPPFSAGNPAVMVLDAAPRVAVEPYAAERVALAAARGA